MSRKAVAIFFLILFLSPSSGFHIPGSCTRIDFGSLINGVDSVTLMKMAGCSADLLRQSYQLKTSLGFTFQLVDTLAENGAEKVLANPASAALCIFSLAPILISYHLSTEAHDLLMRVQFEHDDLRIIDETEVAALLQLMNNLMMKGGKDKGMRNVCKRKDVLKGMLGETIENLKRSRKSIEKLLTESASGEAYSKDLQTGSKVGGAVSAVAIASAPCPFTAFLACPALFVGMTGLIGSWLSYNKFEESRQTYQQIQRMLRQSRAYAMESEKYLKNARLSLESACMELKQSESTIFDNFLQKILDVLGNLLDGIKSDKNVEGKKEVEEL